MSYSVLSEVYDRFAGSDDISKVRFLSKVFGNQNGKIIIDIGCGSGLITAEMARLGYKMIGTDPSEEMLCEARLNGEGLDILLLSQSAEKLDLYGTVDGAYAVTDVINHITSPARLKKAFERISLFMVSGAKFVFDINTEVKFKEMYGKNCYCFDDGDFLVWQNDYNEKSGLCRFDITLFAEKENGLFEKSSESFCERYYSPDFIKALLDETGFEIKKICGGEYSSERRPKETDGRMIFVAVKR